MDDQLSTKQLLEYRTSSGETELVSNVKQWELRRREILQGMEEVMGPLPGNLQGKPLPVKYVVKEETDCGSYVRQLVSYDSDCSSSVPAYLLIPKDVINGNTTAPAVLALHSTELNLGHKVVVGPGGKENRDYGHQLAARGYVVIAPSYPLMADYQPDIKSAGYVSGTMKAIWDNIRALDLLDSLPYVQHGEYGAIGHSLGGHNALFTAAFDSRLKVIASSCGFDSFADYMDGDITGWTQERYMPRLADYKPSSTPFDFYGVIAAIAPRPVFVSAPLNDTNFKWKSVDKIADAARPVYELFNAGKNLRVVHPDCGHDLPDSILEQIYALFDSELKNSDATN